MVFLVFWLVRTSCTPSRRLAALVATPGLRGGAGAPSSAGQRDESGREDVHGESRTAVVLYAASLRPARVPSRAPAGVASRSSTLDGPRPDLRSVTYEVDVSVWTFELSYSTEVQL
jgi:hypothetical protein